jgi:DNA sulfur modification protein DndB
MVNDIQPIELQGIHGICGGREVLLGFAPASLLHSLSFADVLDETTRQGYQRRFSQDHSLEFRKYIRAQGATTIPLTFNLRPSPAGSWKMVAPHPPAATIVIAANAGKVLAQVDCQHRLGFLADVDVPLAFMTYLGLTVREEMEVFNIINGKAKGLSSSLLDFHESRLSKDLGSTRPELYLALRLAEDSRSPWYQRLDLGGNRTVGLYRYASLRTMQKAAKRFLKECQIPAVTNIEHLVDVSIAFWNAVSILLKNEWKDPRRHLLTKGVGVYALMSLAGGLFREGSLRGTPCDQEYFIGVLSDFITTIDWSSSGPLRGFGGSSGADHALELLRTIRKSKLTTADYGKQKDFAY